MRRYSCPTSLEIFPNINIFGDGKANIRTEDFWKSLRNLIRSHLNGSIRLLHLIHAPNDSDNISEVLRNLKDFGIENLVVAGAHWSHFQRKHLRVMPDLKVLNVSGNGIITIDNGK